MNIRISNNLLKLAAANPGVLTPATAIPQKTTASPSASPATLAMSQGASGGYTAPATRAPAPAVDYSKPYTHVNPYAAQYKSQFPKGDEQYAPGSGNAMTPEQMRVRNLYKLNEANLANPGSVSGAALDGGDGAVQTQQQAYSDWMANRNLATLKQMRSEGKFVPDAALQTGVDANYMAQMNATNPGYGSYLGDSLKRVANRWGGDFALEHPNDELLDYSSYALELAPHLLAAAGTGGGSEAPGALNAISRFFPGLIRGATARVAPLATQALARVPGASKVVQFATQGFVPAAEASRTARIAANVGNTLMAPINSAPFINSLQSVYSGPLARLFSNAAMAAPLAQNSIHNIQGITNDVSDYRSANPEAGLASSVGEGAKSTVSKLGIDPTSINRTGMGLGMYFPQFNLGANQLGIKGYNERLNDDVNSMVAATTAQDNEGNSRLETLLTDSQNGNLDTVRNMPWSQVAGYDSNKQKELGISQALAPYAAQLFSNSRSADGGRDPRLDALVKNMNILRSYDNNNGNEGFDEAQLAQEQIMSLMRTEPQLAGYFGYDDQQVSVQPEGAPQG
jgi:hypothetical protein